MRVRIPTIGRRRLGQFSKRARYSDALVSHLREIHESSALGYRKLSAIYGIPQSTVKDWLDFSRRAATPTGYITIDLDLEGPHAVYDGTVGYVPLEEIVVPCKEWEHG